MREAAYRFVLSDTFDGEAHTALDAGLTAFNREVSAAFAELATPGGRSRALNAYVRAADETLLGGIACVTYWGWLSIGLLYLEPAVRGHGLGRRLLGMAENEARQRGCRSSRVTTYSFQARDFYQKQGYQIVGVLKDFPPGGAYYTLRKDFIST
jgi:GNAT superfamily N-acetyltransferase